MFHKTALCGLTVCVTAQWWPLTCILNDIASHARVLNHNNGAPTIKSHATTAGHAAYCGSLLVASGSSIPLHTKMSRWFNGIHRPSLSPWISKLWLWLGFSRIFWIFWIDWIQTVKTAAVAFNSEIRFPLITKFHFSKRQHQRPERQNSSCREKTR